MNVPLAPEEARLLVANYRRIASVHRVVRVTSASDERIVAIHQRVAQAFHQAAKARHETLSAQHTHLISLKFMLVYEMLGERAMQAHLDYEIKHYRRHGLRDDYQQEHSLG